MPLIGHGADPDPKQCAPRLGHRMPGRYDANGAEQTRFLRPLAVHRGGKPGVSRIAVEHAPRETSALSWCCVSPEAALIPL